MNDLLREAWSVIGRDTDEALADSKAVVKFLPRRLLKHVFSSSSSNVSELCLVSLLKELPPPEQAEMAVLVRLPLVSGKDMVSIVAPSNLFDMKQCMEAMAWQADGGKGNVKLAKQVTTKRSFGSPPVYTSSGGKGEKGDYSDMYDAYAYNDGFHQKGKHPFYPFSGGKGMSSNDWFAVLKNL